MPSAFADLIEQLNAAYDDQVSENRVLSKEVRRLGNELTRVRCELTEMQASGAARREPHQLSSPSEEASTMVGIVPAAQSEKFSPNEDEPQQDGDKNITRMVDAVGALPVDATGSQSRFRPNCVIDPNKSAFLSVWDMITMPALLWVALITPIQIGIMVDPPFDAFFVLSLCVDLIFVIDLVLQFFIAYSVPGKRIGFVERRHGKIIQHYLTGWFSVELVTVIPFDLISMSFDADEINRFKAVRVIRTLRLLKLARILKASRLFHRMEITLPLPYQRLALIKFICILVLCCHWQASIWSMTLQLTDEGAPKWVEAIEDAPDPQKYPADVYIAAFYFCCYTMTSVGYGDIGPKNTLERIVCTVIVLVSGLCWAYILGEVSGIVSDLNEEAQSFRKRMDQLNGMLEERGVPEAMKKRLRSFFLSSRARSEHMTQKDLLQNMSPTLQGEVSLILNREWIAKVSFLKEFLDEVAMGTDSSCAEAYRACIADISRSMDTMAVSQSETFLKVQRLHIVYKGLIAIGKSVLRKGDVWGEDFILSDVSLIDAQRCCALTYAELMYIDRATFMEIVEDHKYACPQLKAKIRRCAVRLAVRRGIIAEGRKQTNVIQKTKSGLDNGGKELVSDTTTSQGLSTSPPAQKVENEFVLPHSVMSE